MSDTINPVTSVARELETQQCQQGQVSAHLVEPIWQQSSGPVGGSSPPPQWSRHWESTRRLQPRNCLDGPPKDGCGGGAPGVSYPLPSAAAHHPAAWSEDALIVAGAIWSPCYFTGWTAANHWALTDQVFRSTIVKTTGRVRSSSVQVLEHEYVLSHVMPRDIEWGMRTEWRTEVRLQFADQARTVV